MVRGKIELKKIENVNSQRVAFSKRRAGLFKKAGELSILCDAKVGVVVYSNTGKLYEFASTDCMDSILSKYNVKYAKQCSKPHPETEAGALKSEIGNLQVSLLRLERKDDLGGMHFPELQRLQRELQEGLLLVKDRMTKVALEDLEKSKLQERRVAMENEVLRQRIEVYKRDANARS